MIVRRLDRPLGAVLVDVVLEYARAQLSDKPQSAVLSLNNTDYCVSWNSFRAEVRDPPIAFWAWFVGVRERNEINDVLFLGTARDSGFWIRVTAQDEPIVRAFLQERHLPC